MSSLEIRVCGRYRLEDKIYEGRNASVYTGANVQSDSDCAIKCQSKTIEPSFVLNEGKVLEALQGGIGIPQLMWFGENGDFRFLVTELLGNSLEDYLEICGGKFSLKTTLMVADKIISCIEFMHYKNFIHRDIKPSNFLMGLGKKLHQIYVIDMAYSTTYVNPEDKQHRSNSINENNFVGTLKFASLNVHRGNKNSRRDDLESIGLMLVYFMKGELPWSNLAGESIKEKRKNIRKRMEEVPIEKLCEGLPKQFQEYFQYCRTLSYDDIPDYNQLKRIFKERFIKEGYQFDFIYDWILIPLKLKDTDLSNRIPINRFTKKEESSLSMCNCEYDFKEDFKMTCEKSEEKKKQNIKVPEAPSKIKKPELNKTQPPPSKKTDPNTSKNTNSNTNTKGNKEKGKDDCRTF